MKMISTCENVSRPASASSLNRSSSVMHDVSPPQKSSSASRRVALTTPIGSTSYTSFAFVFFVLSEGDDGEDDRDDCERSRHHADHADPRYRSRVALLR